MAQGHKFQDLEETGEALVAFINSSQPEKLKQVKKEYQALSESHIETKKIVTQILKGTFLDSVTSTSLVQYIIIQFLCLFLYSENLPCFIFIYHPSDLALTEENACQKFLDLEKHKMQKALDCDKVEKQFEQYTAKNQMTKSELQYPLAFCAWIKLFLHRMLGHK